MIKSAKRFEFAAFDIDEDTYVIGQPEAEAVAEAEPEPEPLPEAEPTPPGFTEEELETARQQGYDNGYRAGEEAGREQAAAAQQEKLAVLGEAIAEQLEALMQSEAQRRASAEGDTIAIAHAITRTILPAYTDRYGLQEITKLIETHMAERVEEPRLAIRVADSMLDDVRNWTEPMAQRFGFEGKLVLLADPKLGPQDCLIEWADGGAERRVDAAWQKIDEAVADAAGGVAAAGRGAGSAPAGPAVYAHTAEPPTEKPQNLTRWPDLTSAQVAPSDAPSIPHDRTEL